MAIWFNLIECMCVCVINLKYQTSISEFGIFCQLMEYLDLIGCLKVALWKERALLDMSFLVGEAVG